MRDTVTTTPLSEHADRFRREAAGRLPGRLADLVERRVRHLHQVVSAEPLPDDMTDAESVVIDVAEQFVIDVHGITDAQFATLAVHFSNEEQVAIMFHLALVDGFTKLEKVNT